MLRRARLSASINDLAPFRVASWSRPTAARFLSDVGEDAGFPLTDRWIEMTLDLLRDAVPYHVQLFFAALQDDCDGAPGALSSPVVERCFEERLTGPEGTPYLDHYASRLEFVFESPAREFAYEVLARRAGSREASRTRKSPPRVVRIRQRPARCCRLSKRMVTWNGRRSCRVSLQPRARLVAQAPGCGSMIRQRIHNPAQLTPEELRRP